MKDTISATRRVLEGMHQKQVELGKLAEKLTTSIAGMQLFEPLFKRLAELVEKEETEKTKYR